MPISMSPSAHYVTQSSVYTSPLRGPLTDRRITYWRQRGFYSQNAIIERVAQRKAKAAKRLSKTKLFAKFDLCV